MSPEDLQQSLAEALGWDPVVAEGVVEAVVAASSKTEVEDIVKDYMGGNQQAAELVMTFKTGKAPVSTPASSSQARGSKGQRPTGSLTIKHKPARQGAAGPKPEQRQAVDRAVCNCLQCGKIFFTTATDLDTKQFLESGGLCTFCGAHVALSSQSQSQERPESQASATTTAGQAGGKDDPSVESATQFKDRLVEYDRQAAKRTHVVDDQSDFYAVDSNAWLSTEEKAQLKAQQQQVEAAREARRGKMHVTIDLLGRQVLMADEAEDGEKQEPSEQPGPSGQPAPKSGASTQHQPSSSDFFRVRPCAAPGAFVPSYVSAEPDDPASKSEQKAGARAPADQRAQHAPQPQSRQKGKSKARKAVRFPRLQHDDPLEGIDAGSLAV